MVGDPGIFSSRLLRQDRRRVEEDRMRVRSERWGRQTREWISGEPGPYSTSASDLELEA